MNTTTRRPSAADLEAAMRRHPAGRAVRSAGMTVIAYSPGTLRRSPLPVRVARAALDFVGGWRSLALALTVAVIALTVHGVNAAPAAPAPAPLPLTLADAHGWEPTAILDTTQVESPAIGEAPMLATVEAAWGVVDTVAAIAWHAYMAADGWQPTADVVDADGITHADCYVLTGDTSYRQCFDGYADES